MSTPKVISNQTITFSPYPNTIYTNCRFIIPAKTAYFNSFNSLINNSFFSCTFSGEAGAVLRLINCALRYCTINIPNGISPSLTTFDSCTITAPSILSSFCTYLATEFNDIATEFKSNKDNFNMNTFHNCKPVDGYIINSNFCVNRADNSDLFRGND